MIYKAKNIDTDKFLEQLNYLIDWNETNKKPE